MISPYPALIFYHHFLLWSWWRPLLLSLVPLNSSVIPVSHWSPPSISGLLQTHPITFHSQGLSCETPSLFVHPPPFCHYSLSSHSFCFSVTLRLSLLSHLFRNSPLSPVMLFAQILNGGHLSSGFSLNTSSSKMTVTFHHSGFSLNTSSSHHPIHSSLIPSLSTCHPVSFLSQHLSYLIASYVFVCLLSGLPPSGWRLAVSI